MKFQLMSDLHQETNSRVEVFQRGDIQGDVILLAGDICNSIKQVTYLPKNLEMIHVLGNHEYYEHSWFGQAEQYQQEWEKHGYGKVKVLENQVWEKDGIRILGCTLWTSLTGKEGDYQGFRVSRAMNDFYVIKWCTPELWEQRHKESVMWLKEKLAEPYKGKTIVMTHHCPTYQSQEDQFRNISNDIESGWCSDLDYLIEEEQPEVWIHGHTHQSKDYKIGNTKILCNPGGYPYDKTRNTSYNPILIFEV